MGFIPLYRVNASKKAQLFSQFPSNSAGGFPPSFLLRGGAPPAGGPLPPPPLPPPPPPPSPPPPPPLPPPPPVGMVLLLEGMVTGCVIVTSRNRSINFSLFYPMLNLFSATHGDSQA